MKLKQNFLLSTILVSVLMLLSCEENESGIEFVGFEARFVSDIEGRTVNFNNLSTDAVSFNWDFGDNTFSDLENPSKTYSVGGTFTVTLTATNSEGETDTFQDTFTFDDVFDGGLLVNGDIWRFTFHQDFYRTVTVINDDIISFFQFVDGELLFYVDMA